MDCLVTKLKAVVNNEELLKMDEFKLTALKDSTQCRFNIYYKTGKTGNAKSINNNSVDVTDKNIISVGDLSLVFPENTQMKVSNIGQVYRIDGTLAGNVLELDLNQFVGSVLTYIALGGNGITGNINAILKNNAVTTIQVENSNITDSIYDTISEHATTLTKYYVGGSSGVTGTIDSLLPLTLKNGLLIDVTNTAVTATQSAINTLASRGVTVYINSSQIVE